MSPRCRQAYNGHCEALKTLAETLVNLDVRDQRGRTALYLATERGATDCVEVLTTHGASATLKERKRKWTPLHAAGGHWGRAWGTRGRGGGRQGWGCGGQKGWGPLGAVTTRDGGHQGWGYGDQQGW